MLRLNALLVSEGTINELYKFPTSSLSLLELKGGTRRHLSSGGFFVELITPPNCPILAAVCSVDEFKWPLTKDSVVYRLAVRTFAFVLPGLLYALEFPNICPTFVIDALEQVFRKYAFFEDLCHPRYGFPVKDKKKLSGILEELGATEVVQITQDTLIELGHMTGASRFSVENENPSRLRACRMSAITKLIYESMSIKTMTSKLIEIKGEHPKKVEEEHEGRAYASVNSFTWLVDSAEYSWLVFCGLADKVENAESPLRPPSQDVDYKLWSLNQEGLLVFMHRLESATQLELDSLNENDQMLEADLAVEVPKETTKRETSSSSSGDSSSDSENSSSSSEGWPYLEEDSYGVNFSEEDSEEEDPEEEDPEEEDSKSENSTESSK